MITPSNVLVGTSKSMHATFVSCCYGAGRRLSRRAAKRKVDAPGLVRQLRHQGIHLQAGSYRGVPEEALIAYKGEELVVDTLHEAGIPTKVAKLKPTISCGQELRARSYTGLTAISDQSSIAD